MRVLTITLPDCVPLTYASLNLPSMDPKYTAEMLKHLEKQDELLMDTYRSMSHELHKLQVEEEMLMRAFYDLMAAQGLATKRQDGTSILEEIEPPKWNAFDTNPKLLEQITIKPQVVHVYSRRPKGQLWKVAKSG
ncbi:hypothetical protein LXL04_022023 [Taraxacum kok-saghyz]